jgi:hypothetical protein
MAPAARETVEDNAPRGLECLRPSSFPLAASFGMIADMRLTIVVPGRDADLHTGVDPVPEDGGGLIHWVGARLSRVGRADNV